jgi:uncharacterized protein YkwD
MRRRFVGMTLAVFAAGVLTAESSDSAHAAQRLPVCKASSAVPSAEKSLVTQINRERKRRGAKPLARLSRLVTSARSHNRWMMQKKLFSHPNRGLKFGRGRPASQNLAFMPNARSAFVGFMKSPPHKNNMLPRKWKRIGVGAMKCNGMLLFTVNMTG